MRTVLWITAAVAAAALSGCVTYPVYQPPAPVSRLTPGQLAALDNRPLDANERDRYAKANADVQREDQADLEAQRQAAVVPYTYVYPYSYGYYGYPAPLYGSYGGFYPWYPGLSLSFGYRGGWGGGYRGYRGGYGGHRGGYGGHRGGGGGYRR